mgnify:CR=1 FL=1
MSLAEDWNSGGSASVPGSAEPNLRDYMHALHGVASLTALKAIKAGQRDHGMPARVTDGVAAGPWRFHATCALTGDDVLVVTPADNPTVGRWLRDVGACELVFPFTFETADAAVHCALQAGCFLHVLEPSWMVSTSFTGGTSSTIGLSSNKTGFTSKGDLLGGAAGDAAANLTASATVRRMGTIGAGFDTLAKRRVIWGPGDNFRHDRITSAFAAGVGQVRVSAIILQNAGS